MNTDSLWTEGTKPSLERLRQSWDDRTMDMLLLLSGTTASYSYSGRGDFHCGPDGTLTRRAENEIARGPSCNRKRLFFGLLRSR